MPCLRRGKKTDNIFGSSFSATQIYVRAADLSKTTIDIWKSSTVGSTGQVDLNIPLMVHNFLEHILHPAVLQILCNNFTRTVSIQILCDSVFGKDQEKELPWHSPMQPWRKSLQSKISYINCALHSFDGKNDNWDSTGMFLEAFLNAYYDVRDLMAIHKGFEGAPLIKDLKNFKWHEVQRWKHCLDAKGRPFILLFRDKCNREDLYISPRNPNDGATQYLNKIPWQCGCGNNYD